MDLPSFPHLASEHFAVSVRSTLVVIVPGDHVIVPGDAVQPSPCMESTGFVVLGLSKTMADVPSRVAKRCRSHPIRSSHKTLRLVGIRGMWNRDGFLDDRLSSTPKSVTLPIVASQTNAGTACLD